MKVKGYMDIVDDYGSHHYTVRNVKDGCYYFIQKTLDGNALRYNEKEGRVEELIPDGKGWDVYSAYIYQADFITKEV